MRDVEKDGRLRESYCHAKYTNAVRRAYIQLYGNDAYLFALNEHGSHVLVADEDGIRKIVEEEPSISKELEDLVAKGTKLYKKQ